MADTRDEIQAALEEARKAREEADRVRREAKLEAERLRDDARRARDEARRLRDQAREQARNERHGPPRGFMPPHSPGHRGGLRFGFDAEDDGSGVRTEHALSMDGVRFLQLDQSAGKLTMRACKEGETPGLTSIGNKVTPEVHINRLGERLVIEVKLGRGGLFRRRQGASTVVRVDNITFEELRIDNSYGETLIQGLSAKDLRVHVGAGTVQCIQTRGTIHVGVGAGKLAVLSHSGLARCDSGTGDVLVDIAELAEGEYKVDVGIGRAEIRLPAGGEVHIQASSGLGKSRIEYPSALEGAATRLRLNTGIGECVVKARDATATGAAAQPGPASEQKPQRTSRAAAASRRREGEEMRVLQMLEQGKISPQDAADLIAALQGSTAPQYDEPDDDGPGVFQA